MKQQIVRFSPHQNAKVFAVLMAIASLVFLVPFMLLTIAMTPQGAAPPWAFVIALPLLYFVFGYISIAIGCWLYNFLYPRIGGIEFEAGESR